ncbi:murein transglycosylase A [Hoeflea sp. Naph1]|uniref:murein transglycosylase A n=1 Tax=Hoeflea sp. Naph1 TaxID=3388653 RepID=UPI00398FBD31
MNVSLRREEFASLPGWADDAPAAALAAFCRSARYVAQNGLYKTGALGLSAEGFKPAYDAALTLQATESGLVSEGEARAFFEKWFRPVRIDVDDGAGFVTGYYEPELEVTATADPDHAFPFLRKPDNLVKVSDPDNPPVGIPDGYAFMLEQNGEGSVCPDRQAIETGAFGGQGLEIAWAGSRADVFFAHVQGCARLAFPNGRNRRITYAAKSGHPFTGIGGLLVERGEIAASDISMAAIRQWLAANPQHADQLMWQNRSFIFFREADVDDPRLGPVAAAKVPLEPGRSLAVDRHIHTFGTPFFINAPDLADFDADRPFARLMIAQDTGTAIVGATRGDLFAGSGPVAGDKAGAIRNKASFTLLAPAGSQCARRAGHER